MNPPPSAALTLPSDTAGRTRLVLIVLALLAPFALYFGTARSIVEIWDSSETFAHGYVILPICLWLIWRRRANFATYPPTPYWPALGLLALAGAAWLLARMGEVQVVQQYAMVAMLPLIALAVLGRQLAGSLAFPLLFALFAVPFGDIFIAPLISFTADFTVRAVQLSGIPVLRNGTRFELPTGSWSVVEACSGVRYLISSVTIGCLYAYLTYRSTARRMICVALAVVVPIIANGLRAYMIVMIGHFSGMELATGVDHLVYGWLFFGLVMFIMFWIGNYWRQDQDPVAVAAAAAPRAVAARSGAAIVVAVVATIALWPAFALYNDRASYNPKPVRLDQVAVGWAPAQAFSNWTPYYMQPDASFVRAYQAPDASPVAVKLLFYRNQSKKKALISSLNRVTAYNDAYNEVSATMRSETSGGQPLALRESVVHGPDGSLLVWHWMWIDGRTVTNNYVGKLRQAQAKLLLRGDDGAQVFLAAPYSEKPEQARASLRAFLAQNGGAIEAALAAAHRN